MNRYTPDAWVLIEIAVPTEAKPHHRILAGWYGGFTGGDSWRMSSGVTKVVDCDTYWEIHNESGSVYECHKECERFTGYTSSVYRAYLDQADRKLNMDHVLLESVMPSYIDK